MDTATNNDRHIVTTENKSTTHRFSGHSIPALELTKPTKVKIVRIRSFK